MLENDNWQNVDPLAIYKRGPEVEPPRTNPTSGQNGNWTRGHRILSLAP